MSTLVFPKDTAQAMQILTGEAYPEVAFMMVMRDAFAYRMEQIEDESRTFERKYGMFFDEYKQGWESEDRDEDYQWESERDYLEWEALITRKHRLKDTYSWLI